MTAEARIIEAANIAVNDRAAFSREALRAEVRRRLRERETFEEYMVRTSGGEPIPAHLDPVVAGLTEAAERSEAGESSKYLFKLPPGFGKSTTVRRWIGWRLQRNPAFRTIYRSYSAQLARSHVRGIRDVAVEFSGIRVDPTSRSVREWRVRGTGGYVLASGITGTGTGYRADCVVTDDYHTDRTEAESITYRERAIDSHKSVSSTRLDKGGANLIVSTPWHPQDLAGWAEAHGYIVVRVPALDPITDLSVWPDVKLTSELHTQREDLGERDWTALYLCQPTSLGTQIFRDARVCEAHEVPLLSELQLGIGIDLAYSVKTASRDYSVIVVVGLHVATKRLFVLDVRRTQVTVDRFAPELAAVVTEYPGAPIVWHAGGHEAAIAPMLECDAKVRIRVETAKSDKVTRASPLSVWWNRGSVLVPRRLRDRTGQIVVVKWADPYIREVCGFGPGARYDDQIDATVSAADAAGAFKTGGGPRGRARGTGEGSVRDRLGGVVAA